MKIVLTEVPFSKDREMHVEHECCPAGAELVVAVYDENSNDNEAFYKEIEDADIIVNSYVYFGKKEIDTMKKCKVISFQSTGFNEVDLDYATEKGVGVVSILDYCTEETAENTMALILCLERSLRIYDRSVQVKKEWNFMAAYEGWHLKRMSGQTVGIVGLGRIGQAVACRCQSFNMRVVAYDPFLPPEVAKCMGVDLVDLDYLLAESDVISIHMNLTDENYHMFNKDLFMKCKKHPFLVNEGRGAMICEDDLLWALDNGYIKAAALDMLESENPEISKCDKLLGRDDLVLTPHCGYWSDTSDYLAPKYSMENALHYFNGEYDLVKVERNHIKH